MDAEQSRQYLDALRAKVDTHFEEARRTQPEAFACASGCSRCCEQRFSVFEIEAERIRAALVQLERSDPETRERVRRQADDPAHAHACALLVEGVCSVYEQRPIICRTHGLPSPRDDGSIDVCPLNFREHTPHPRSLLAIDRVNQPLAVMATMHRGGDARVELAALAREASRRE